MVILAWLEATFSPFEICFTFFLRGSGVVVWFEARFFMNRLEACSGTFVCCTFLLGCSLALTSLRLERLVWFFKFWACVLIGMD